MDYQELLFAATVRDIAGKRVRDRMPESMSNEDRAQFMLNEFPAAARAFAQELREVAAMLRQPEGS